MSEKNYFEQLNAVNVNEHTEKKNGLTYLSWSYAWGELKKRFPMSFYTIYEDARGLNYFTDGKTAYVKTGVTAVMAETSIEHIEYLPVMDYKNQSIPFERITSFDVNKAIQRSLTKAVARHGLGLYIYAGEDLPEEEAAEKKPSAPILKKSFVTEVQQPKMDKPSIPVMQADKLSDEKLSEEQMQKIIEAFEVKYGKCEKGNLATAKFRGFLSEYGAKKLGDLSASLYEDVLTRIKGA